VKKLGEETKLQQGVMKWASMQTNIYPELQVLYAIPNGANTTRANRIRLVAEGLKKGMPDLCLPVPRGVYGALFIELKTDKGKVSKVQREMHELLDSSGNMVVVCRNLFQVINTIQGYLNHDTQSRD